MISKHKSISGNPSNTNNKENHPKIVLVGQPNSGKSTIFNKVAGYRSISSNFPGSTVAYTNSRVQIEKKTVEIVDLPGIYSLTSSDVAAEQAKKFILNQNFNLIINVIDASILSRSLELSLQLLELGIPVLICLNMMDEAVRKGIFIDADKLSNILHVPVITTIASQGHGIDKLFSDALVNIRTELKSKPFKMSKHVEDIVLSLSRFLEDVFNGKKLNFRLLALRLIEEDAYYLKWISEIDTGLQNALQDHKDRLTKEHAQPAYAVISAERHSQAMALFERVANVEKPRQSVRDKVDNYLMHPIGGYIFMIAFMFVFFNVIFKFGSFIENPILSFFENNFDLLAKQLHPHEFTLVLLQGIFQGFAGGVAIVLPYLLPFLIGMAVIEDIGYLPRIAFLMDSFMHKIGLHGTSVVPAILGYGCSVPAVMATRMLARPRDRFISAMIAILIPCSARMTVIFGLVGFYLGGSAALFIYLFNLVVIGIMGGILSSLMPEDSPGMVLEIPSYKKPRIDVILAKSWLRIKDFIIMAWPILILGSILLSFAEWYHLDKIINRLSYPVTYILGLPEEVGMTLVFGILRKELSMVMLLQALGTMDVSSVLTSAQIMVFTLFVVFYFPCLATFGVLGREIGWSRALIASVVTFIIALVIGFLARIISPILL